MNGSIFAVAIGLLHIRNHAANQKQRCFRDQEETIRSDIVLDIPQEQSNKTVLHLKKSFLVTAKCRNRDSRNRIQMPERKWRQTVFSAIRFTEKETLFCELPEIVVENLAVWDDYDTDYTIFNVCGNDIRVYDDELAEALKQLSERNRETLLMYYFLEMNNEEIAKKQNISRSGVFQNRHNSLALMKKLLKEKQ